MFDKKYIIAIIVIIIFSITIYYIIQGFSSTCSSGNVYDPVSKKCHKKCDNPTIWNIGANDCTCPNPLDKVSNGICQESCQDNYKICGSHCYDPDILTCTNNNTLCLTTNLCTDPKGVQTCCPINTLCNKNTGICNHCVSGNNCGPNCCPAGQTTCIGDICCSPDKISVDSNGQSICCTGNPCTDNNGKKICCETSNMSCNPKTNTCGIRCPTDSDIFCDPSSQYCDTYTDIKSGNTKHFCANKGCVWSTPLEYTPVGRSLQAEGKNFNVCNIDNKYYSASDSKDGGAMTRTGSTHKDQTESTSICSMDDCQKRMSESGVTNIDFINDTCTAKYNCRDPNVLPCSVPSDKCLNPTPCPYINSPSSAGACCKDSSGIFTGQICEPNETCLPGGTCTSTMGCIYPQSDIDAMKTKCADACIQYHPNDYKNFNVCFADCALKKDGNEHSPDIHYKFIYVDPTTWGKPTFSPEEAKVVYPNPNTSYANCKAT